MKPTSLFNSKGFTLVEAIVAGALSIFVLLTAITLYKMNADQIRGTLLDCLTRMQYQTVINEIESKARKATTILSFTDNSTFDTITAPSSHDTIFLMDGAGNTLGGFTHNGQSLREYKGGSFRNFKVGNKNVKVKDTTLFTIAGDRKSVQLNLTVFGIDGSLSDTALSKKEIFTCRN